MSRTARDPGTEARVAGVPVHLVHFYEKDETLAGAIAKFVMDGL